MDFDSISPRDFEELVASIFETEGYSVSTTPQTRDGGIDVIAERVNNLGLPDQWIIECKKYSSDRPIGVEIIRQLAGVKSMLRARNAAVVSSTRFSKAAQDFAQELNIDLVDGDKVSGWLEIQGEHSRKDQEKPSRFHSVFISHSHRDHEFVTRLNSALREKGIKTWFSHEDLEVGQKIHEALFSAIESFDRLIIVLSEDSMKSPWVISELRRAMAREKAEGTNVLFPISLVPYEKLSSWSCFDSDTGSDIAVEIRQYLIPCISENATEDEFNKLVVKLASALREN